MRFWAIGLISFFSITAGSLLHRILAVSLCGVLGFNSTVCYLGDSSRVNAAEVLGRGEKEAIVAQGVDIFRNDGGSPPAPNVDIFAPPNPTSPQLDTPNPNQPIQPQLQTDNNSLSGIWLYSLYESPSEENILYMYMLKILQDGDKYSRYICHENCG
jgi:hypothetical protein